MENKTQFTDIPEMANQYVFTVRGVNMHAGTTYFNYYPAPPQGDITSLLSGSDILAGIAGTIKP